MSNALILDGAAHTVILSGSNTVWLFHINPGAELTLLGLTLADDLALGANGNPGVAGGLAEGGAIHNRGGVLRAEACSFRGNQAQGGTGGGRGGPQLPWNRPPHAFDHRRQRCPPQRRWARRELRGAADAVFVLSNQVINVGPDAIAVDFFSYRSNAFALERLTGDRLRTIFAGHTGDVWHVQAATNCVDWVISSTNTVESSGLFELLISDTLQAQLLFLRALKP